ncbi:MAG: TlpA family protein disulfide reductase [Candidatus Eiseniibacteriota bacterium]
MASISPDPSRGDGSRVSPGPLRGAAPTVATLLALLVPALLAPALLIPALLPLVDPSVAHAGQAPPAPAPATARPKAPEIVVRDLSGETVRLSSLKGKVVLIDYWATWCGPCRMEVPHFKKLHAELGPKGLVILGLSVDHQGAEVVRGFVKRNAIPWTTALADEKVVEAFGELRAIPTAIVIDREGRIAARLVGYQDESRLRAVLKPLL